MLTPLLRRAVVAVALLAGLRLAAPLAAQDDGLSRAEYIEASYTKHEHHVPMRDGVRLFTAIYVPKDTSRTYPFLMIRTPYSSGPYGEDRSARRLGPYAEFEREGFIFVEQDVRGRYMSEGTFVNMRPHVPRKASDADVDESTDTYDTIQWLLENVENHNGRVGMWGISYPGFYAAAGMIDSHPALKAVSPQAPIADWFIGDDMHHNGALILPITFNFFSGFGQKQDNPTTERSRRFDHGTVDGYQFFLDLGPLSNVNDRHFHGEIEFWNHVVAHPNYDEFWQSRNLLPHLNGVGCAVMTVGGWFDSEDLYGPLSIYASVERRNPGIFNVLVMGPWPHGGWARSGGESLGDLSFGFPTSQTYRDRLGLPFFTHYLKDGPAPDIPEALVFETGVNRWREFDTWPPETRRARDLYLRSGGRLAFAPPVAAAPASDAYTSDPDKPVPYTMEITTRWSRSYMTEDQRFAGWRPDVLVYATDPLEEALTIAGPIEARLQVSTTGTDSDWIVKVIDVYPGENPEDPRDRDWPGHRQQLVRSEVMRGRFRESFSEPRPFVPGEVTAVTVPLRDVLHTFRPGHRVMVQIQSTWFPFVDRNPQTYVPNIYEADDEDFVAVENRVHRSRQHPSFVRLGVLE